MKILLWAPFGAGTHYWGPGTSAYRLYKTNKDPSIKVTLIHASEKQGDFPEVYDEQIKLPTLRGKGLIGKFKYILAASKWIKENYNNYDIVHGISAYEYTFRPMLKFAKYGIPVFIKLTGAHGGFGQNSKTSKLLGLAKNRIKHANRIRGYIAISNMIKSNLLKYNIDENLVFEIPNGVNIERFKPIDLYEKVALRERLNIKNKFTFMYVGGLTFNKRIIEIVKAIILLKEEGVNDFQFIMVGPDRNKGLVDIELEKLIKEGNLEDIVIRIGQTETPELYLQSSDVFTLVSKSEGMSNALLEAMACGLPALVTDISGSQDLVIDMKNGVYTTGHVGDIASKLKWFLNNAQHLTMFGELSRKIIVTSYSDEYVFKKHIELFKTVEN